MNDLKQTLDKRLYTLDADICFECPVEKVEVQNMFRRRDESRIQKRLV